MLNCFLAGQHPWNKARAMSLKKTPALIQEWVWPTAPWHYSSKLSSCGHNIVPPPHASALWCGDFMPAERNAQITSVLCSKKAPPAWTRDGWQLSHPALQNTDTTFYLSKGFPGSLPWSPSHNYSLVLRGNKMLTWISCLLTTSSENLLTHVFLL